MAQEFTVPKYNKLEPSWVSKDVVVWLGVRRKHTGSRTWVKYPGKNIRMMSGCVAMGSEKLRCSWSWIWQGMQRIRRASTVSLVRKGRLKEMYPSNKQDRRTSDNWHGWHGEGWGTHYFFCLNFQCQSVFPHLSNLFLKRLKRRTSNQSASSLCQVRSWNKSSWKICQSMWKTGRWQHTTQLLDCGLLTVEC